MRKIIKKVTARKSFSMENQDTGVKVEVSKGEPGELLGKKPGKGYTIIINNKTIYIQERKLLRYLFKVE